MKKNLWVFSWILLTILAFVTFGRTIQWLANFKHNAQGFSNKAYSCPIVKNQSFVILLISYGDFEKTKDSLRSIFEQNYRNFRIIYLDQSHGQSLKKEEEFIEKNHQQHRVLFIKEKDLPELQKIYLAISSCQDEEIVLLMREGDFLAHTKVLFALNQVYANSDIWLAYGGHLYFPSYAPSDEKPFCASEILKKKERKRDSFDFGLKTFYAGLFKKIAVQDLLYAGHFFFYVEDYALMMPMLEMASSHILYLPEIHYLKSCRSFLTEEEQYIEVDVHPFYLQILKRRAPYPSLNRLPYREEWKITPTVDLILFAHNALSLERSLDAIEEKMKGKGKIFVIVPQQNLIEFEKCREKYPQTIFLKNAEDLKGLLVQIFSQSNANFLLCGQDDYLIASKIDLKKCVETILRTKARGFYLSLGEGSTFCSRGGFTQPLPANLLSLPDDIKAWECQNSAAGDWAFPDGFMMAIYEKNLLRKLFDELSFRDLKELEKSWSLTSQERKVGLCFPQAAVRKIEKEPSLQK